MVSYRDGVMTYRITIGMGVIFLLTNRANKQKLYFKQKFQ